MNFKRTIVASLLLASPALAHHDPETMIEELSVQIEKSPGAELFFKRATEYRALRDAKNARADFRSALEIDPAFTPALRSLVELDPAASDSMKLAQDFLKLAEDDLIKREALLLLARVHQAQEKFDMARSLCKKIRALQITSSEEVDLFEANLLLDQKQLANAVELLDLARKRTASIVVRNLWIDTLLSAGKTEEVLPIIEAELADSRLRSSWLIRRARARLATDQKADAKSDLQAALTEIESRLHPDRPDLTLIADRGIIHALLGDRKSAQADLAILKKSSLAPSAWRLLDVELAKDSSASR